MDHLLAEMGARIAQLRRERDLTQEALAELAGLTSQTISTAELGKKALRPENIVKISRCLDVSTDYLLTGCKTGTDLESLNEKLTKASRETRDRIIRVIEILLEDC